MAKNKRPLNMIQLNAEQRREKVAEYYLMGYTQQQIADRMECSQPAISNDLAAIRKMWAEAAVQDFNSAKAEVLHRLDILERVAWKAWRKSCKPLRSLVKRIEKVPIEIYDKEKDQNKEQPKRGPGRPKKQPINNDNINSPVPEASKKARDVIIKAIDEIRSVRKEGNPKFLDRIAWCIEQRMKIFGLTQPDLHVHNNAFLDWDSIAKRIREETKEDPIASRIAQIEAMEVKRLSNSPTPTESEQEHSSDDNE